MVDIDGKTYYHTNMTEPLTQELETTPNLKDSCTMDTMNTMDTTPEVDARNNASMMDTIPEAVLGPGSTPQPFYKHSPVKQHKFQISHRDFYVLSLHLSGHSAEKIAELAGYSSAYSVHNILRKQEVILVRQQLLQSLELEFEALQKKIFQVVENKLDSEDERVQLEAVHLWMKYFGKFTPKPDKDELTAEDVVRQILNQQINININTPNPKGSCTPKDTTHSLITPNPEDFTNIAPTKNLEDS